MAVIPTLQRQKLVPRFTGVGAPPVVLIQDYIGNAISNVGNALGTIAKQMNDEAEQRQATNMKVQAIMDLQLLEMELAKDPDYLSRSDKFNTAVKELEAGYKKTYPSYGEFQWIFSGQVAQSLGRVRTGAFQAQIDQSKAELNTNLDVLVRAHGNAANDFDRADIAATAKELIEGRAATGIITQVDATSRLKSFTSSIIETQVRNDLFVNPEGTLEALLKGGYPELNPEKRGIWAERASSRSDALRAMRVRLGDRQESDAAKALKVAEEQVGKDGYELLAKNKLTMAWVIANERKLSKSDYKTLLDKLTGGDATEDNTDVVADLYTRVGSEDVKADAIAAYRRGDLTRQTMGAIISRNDKLRGGDSPKDAYKRGQSYIKTSLGVNEMASIPGQRRRLADAVIDFDQWIELNPDAKDKDVIETARRLVREYSIVDWNRMSISLPMPSWFVGSRQAPDLDASKQSLVSRFMLKHGDDKDAVVADPEYQRAVRVIRQWEAAIQKRDLSTGATQQ
jgi:hypothetical protein